MVTKQNDLQRTLDSTVSTISSHTSSIDGLETKYSQIKQTADSVQTTVSNMKISSRNLLKNTDFKQGKSYWNSDIDIKTSTDDLTPGGNYSALIVKTGNTSDIYGGISQKIRTVPNGKLKNNTDYMLSFYIWFNVDNPIDDQFGIEIKATKSDGTHSTVQSHTFLAGDSRLETGSWLRFTIPFNFNTSTRNHFVYIWTKKNGTFWIGDMMLTESNQYVPWVNASEDNREYAESKITQTASEVRYEFKHGGGFPNLLYNSSPEYNNDTGWGYFQASKYTGDTNYSELGFYIPDGYDSGCLVSPEVSVSAGKTYSFTLSMFVEQNCTNPQVGLRIRYTDGSLTYPVGVSSSTIVKWNGSNSKWWRYTFSYTMPDNADYVRLEFGQGARGANSGYVIRIRNVMIIEGEGIYPNRWYPNSNEIQSNTTTIDINGVNVRHSDGARTNLNSTALNFYDTSDRLYSQVANGRYHFWYGSKYVGFLGHNGWVEDQNRRNVALSAEHDCFVALGAKKTSSDTSYTIFLAVTGNDKTVGGTKYPTGVNIISPHVNGIIKMYGTANNSDACPAQIFNNSGGQLTVAGDNYTDLCIMNGSQLCVGLRVAEDNSQSNNTAVRCYGPLSMNGYPTYASTMITPIDITSAQSYALRNADGDSYSDPTSETVTHLYAPKSTTDGEVRWTDRQTHHTSEWEDGIYESYIEIPWWVAESMELDYHVTITPVNGFYQYYVSERDPYYFIVRSDKEGMGFTFEINGKLLDNKTEGKNTSIASQQYNVVPEKSPDTISDVRIPVESTPMYPIEDDSIQADIGEINTGE